MNLKGVLGTKNGRTVIITDLQNSKCTDLLKWVNLYVGNLFLPRIPFKWKLGGSLEELDSLDFRNSEFHRSEGEYVEDLGHHIGGANRYFGELIRELGVIYLDTELWLELQFEINAPPVREFPLFSPMDEYENFKKALFPSLKEVGPHKGMAAYCEERPD